MEINASAKHDLETLTTFIRVGSCGKFHPKKLLIRRIIYSSIGLIAAISAIITKMSIYYILFALFYAFLCSFTTIYMYFFAAKARYKTMGTNKDSISYYTFRDEDFIERTVSEGSSGENIIKYTSLFKITESNQFLYLFINNATAYIVDKSTFSDDINLLREKLLAVPNIKYNVVKY